MPIGPGDGVRVEDEVVFRRTPAELYRLWQDLDAVGRALAHVEEIHALGGGRSHWVAKGPLGVRLEWDAEIVADVPNELIAWQSLPGSDVDTAGSIHFTPVGDGGATAVRVVLRYAPPAGKLGAAVAALLGADPAVQLADDLRRLKQQVESGRLPAKDDVQIASEQSFPASDAPAWTARR